MAEGGDTRPNGESYVETICGRGGMVYGCGRGWLEITYKEHDLVILPRSERGVSTGEAGIRRWVSSRKAISQPIRANHGR